VGRFLFVVPPLQGHVNPTLAVGRALERRGHHAAWVADDVLIGPLLPNDVTRVATGDDVPAEWFGEVDEAGRGLRGAASLEFLWRRLLVPLAVGMVPGVEKAVDAWGPDVLVVDQQALAGAVVARRRGLRWATSATTSAEMVDPFRLLPKVGAWVRGQLEDLARQVGLPSGPARADLRFSEHLVLAFTTEELAGSPETLAATTGVPAERIALVGPALEARRTEDDDFDDDWLEDRRSGGGQAVLVTLGSIHQSAGDRFFATVLEALAPLSVAAVLVADPERVGPLPVALAERVLVRARIPQLRVLGGVDAVIGHGGHNTTCEALAAGLPLVVAPIRDDQPVVAEQVVNAGAAVRVRFGRVQAAELRAAIETVLTEPSYRAAAGRIRASFEAAGGAEAAADHLERLLD
jgi:MGT family glycosyltransferase